MSVPGKSHPQPHCSDPFLPVSPEDRGEAAAAGYLDLEERRRAVRVLEREASSAAALSPSVTFDEEADDGGIEDDFDLVRELTRAAGAPKRDCPSRETRGRSTGASSGYGSARVESPEFQDAILVPFQAGLRVSLGELLDICNKYESERVPEDPVRRRMTPIVDFLELNRAFFGADFIVDETFHEYLSCALQNPHFPVEKLNYINCGGEANVYSPTRTNKVALRVLFNGVDLKPDSEDVELSKSQLTCSLALSCVARLTGKLKNSISEITTPFKEQVVGVMELAKGTFRRELAETPGVGERIQKVLQVMLQVARFHEGGWIHRDLKPENLLVTKDGGFKLADFGTAQRVGEASTEKNGLGVGYTAPYSSSPEAVDPPDFQSHSFGVETDYWAIGFLLLQAITGMFPTLNPEMVNQAQVMKIMGPEHKYLHILGLDVEAGRRGEMWESFQKTNINERFLMLLRRVEFENREEFVSQSLDLYKKLCLPWEELSLEDVKELYQHFVKKWNAAMPKGRYDLYDDMINRDLFESSFLTMIYLKSYEEVDPSLFSAIKQFLEPNPADRGNLNETIIALGKKYELDTANKTKRA